jgi:O-antigen/teichoic acid export membrane protein
MSSQISKIRKNSLFSLLSSLIRLLSNFLLFVGIARLYGAEAFGSFTTAHALAIMFIMIADFGFDSFLATEIARDRSKSEDLTRRLLSLKIVFAVAATLAMSVLPLIRTLSSSTASLVEVLSLYVFLSAVTNFFFALFRGFEELHHETRITFTVNVLLLFSLGILGLFHARLIFVGSAFVLSRVIAVVMAARAMKLRLLMPQFRFSVAGWKNSWQQVSVFGLHALFGNLFFTIDTILIAFLCGDEATGIYQSVFKIVALVLVLPDIIMNSFLPVLARLHVEDENRWAAVGIFLNKILLLLSLPITLNLFIFSEQIIHIVYGTGSFVQAVPILQVFSIVILVRFIGETSGLILTTSRRQSIRMVTVLCATILNVSLNVLYIPKFGVMGAAVISLVTNTLVMATYVWRSGFNVWKIDINGLMATALLFGSAFLLWPARMVSVWLVFPAGLIIDCLVILFVGCSKEERIIIFSRKPIPSSHNVGAARTL